MRDTIAQQLDAHPADDTLDPGALAESLDAVLTCVATCSLCADACVDIDGMADCVRRCTDCATVCAATATILARPTPHGEAWRSQVEACIVHCQSCVDECGSHDHDHCRNCAAACRTAVDALRALLDAAD